MARPGTKDKSKATKVKSKAGPKKNSADLWFFEHPEPIIRFTGWVAFLAFASTVVSALQWCTLRETNRISQAMQRPKLSLTNSKNDPGLLPVVVRGEKALVQLAWNWDLTNFGQGMAKDVVIDTFVRLDTDGPFRRNFAQIGVGGGGDLPPGSIVNATISSEPMIESYGDERLKKDYGVSFLVLLRYKDDIGNTYETDVCVSHYANGAMPFLNPDECKKHIEERPE